MKLNYYARIDEDNVCIEIVSTPRNLKGIKGYVYIDRYSEDLLYRQFDGFGWSEEKHYPDGIEIVENRLRVLEEKNMELMKKIDNLALEVTEVSGASKTRVK